MRLKIRTSKVMRLKRMRIGDVVDEDGNIDADADGDLVDTEAGDIVLVDGDVESLKVMRPKMRTSKVMRLRRMRIGDVVDEDGNIDVVDADTDLVDTEAGDIVIVDGDVESLKV